jgi:hypothetical protein
MRNRRNGHTNETDYQQGDDRVLDGAGDRRAEPGHGEHRADDNRGNGGDDPAPVLAATETETVGQIAGPGDGDSRQTEGEGADQQIGAAGFETGIGLGDEAGDTAGVGEAPAENGEDEEQGQH